MSKKEEPKRRRSFGELIEEVEERIIENLSDVEDNALDEGIDYNCADCSYDPPKPTATDLIDTEILSSIKQLEDSSLQEAMHLAYYIKDLQQIKKEL